MKKKELLINVQAIDYGQQKQIKINVNDSTRNELCMMLLLLREGLVDAIEISCNNFTFIIEKGEGNHSICDHLDIPKGIFKGRVSLNNLEYVIYFLLKYYLHEVGEAEHIDVDFENESGEDCTLTFMCEKYKEYSGEEIKEILK